jgi:hypothetical protein
LGTAAEKVNRFPCGLEDIYLLVTKVSSKVFRFSGIVENIDKNWFSDKKRIIVNSISYMRIILR